jgi:hypothetical protein
VTRGAVCRPRLGHPQYRVTLRRTTVEIVEATNPYQAAIVASRRDGGDVEIADVRPAVGRPTTATKATKTTKKVAKERRPLSPEARARLAQNLVKARAARSRNLKAAKKKVASKKTTKRAVKKK